MAEPFLALDTGERADILRTAATRSQHSAVVLEKDIWVCWALDALFSMPDPHPMAFKGGTSLSKVYGVIDRFSEDVDITLDYRAFDDGFDPFADGASRTATRRFSERLRDRVASHVRAAVVPALNDAARRLAPDGRYDIHVGEDGETVRFAYPSAVDAPDSYVASEVLLEFGGRNVIDPNERHAVIPDMATLTDGLDYPAATVTVLCPARTFWEKATLIHVACHRRQLSNKPDRLIPTLVRPDVSRRPRHRPHRHRRPQSPRRRRPAQEGVLPCRQRQLRPLPRRLPASRPRRRSAPRPSIGLRRHAQRPHRRRRRTGFRSPDGRDPQHSDPDQPSQPRKRPCLNSTRVRSARPLQKS